MTKLEACKEWVNGFNAIPQSLIERAFKHDIDNWIELTPITKGDVVWSNEYQETGEIFDIDRENETAVVNIKEEKITIDIDDLDVERDGWLPMWGWLWMFDNNLDEEWTRNHLTEVAECGFRIFEDGETGDIYIGIDGAGYDFYEQHWLPLYDVRGLQWHI